jgi:hypothetical protein
MKLWLWIDDFHKPPHERWTWAKTLEEAMAYVTSSRPIEIISFDHDLGVKDLSRMGEWVNSQPVAKWYETEAENGNLLAMPIWRIHSRNPRGCKELRAILERAERFIAERKPDGQA